MALVVGTRRHESEGMIELRYSFGINPEGFVWRVDSPDIPDLHASARTLVDCQQRALDELAAQGFDVGRVRRTVVGMPELNREVTGEPEIAQASLAS
jgi:hypothetical protein